MDAKSIRLPRRAFLGGTALTGAGLLAASPARAAEPSAVETANEAVVNAFCAAWKTLDANAIGEHLADDCVFQMIETAPQTTGKTTIVSNIAAFLTSFSGSEFEVLRSSAMGNVVMNDRIDHFFAKDGKPDRHFHVTGFFLVKDGKIVEWRDFSFPKGDE